MKVDWDLSEYDDPKLYDIENKKTNELAFLIKWAEKLKIKQQTIVDLACGTGRITIPFAEKGYCLLGVDVHEGMLERAREKTKPDHNVSWINQNCMYLILNTYSPFTYMVGRAFQHFLTDEHQHSLFQSIHHILEKKGVFIFDTMLPSKQCSSLPSTKEIYRTITDVKNRKCKIYYEMNVEADADIIHYKLTREFLKNNSIVEERVSISKLRYTPIETLVNTLESNGFKLLHIYRGWREKPFHFDNHYIVIVCQKL
ncbi:class I SAM-dependent methyltransferase [Chengkuizengella axinellae]|uniref:Class I SAM-dependent methyltransferase n=1 Tax=Chengkuizengella axinellae TaxID=3064388 RepID=A0ABT9J6D0_9BACL|nr:class I SAM-dependent methyltransferase [Chengkuizengella sp. 2205SS18-9]MDP5276555.1 class I SAM-dependent methyltransferase [Chengkuizengella sp. 2205SS18-9]